MVVALLPFMVTLVRVMRCGVIGDRASGRSAVAAEEGVGDGHGAAVGIDRAAIGRKNGLLLPLKMVSLMIMVPAAKIAPPPMEAQLPLKMQPVMVVVVAGLSISAPPPATAPLARVRFCRMKLVAPVTCERAGPCRRR